MDVYFNNNDIILMENNFNNYDYYKHIDNNIISDILFKNDKLTNNEILIKLNNIKYNL